MSELKFLTAGESHGKNLTGILEGMPAGLKLELDKINHQLSLRQQGYGRSGRMRIESDCAEILSGVRFGETTGSPVAVLIPNKDWENWKDRMAVWEGKDDNPVTIPRPGHADFAGGVKYDHRDLRNVLERASARETAMRVALGAIVRQFLEAFGIDICGHVIQIGRAGSETTFQSLSDADPKMAAGKIRSLCQKAEASDVRCVDPAAAEAMKQEIDRAKSSGDSLGGMIELAALNVPIGLGSHAFWDRKLDALIAGDMMSVPGIKSVEIGAGRACASRPGSEMHDPFTPGPKGLPQRASNHAGGIEGGISNGQPVLVWAAMKPIPTLTKPLPSVDLATGEAGEAHRERSDICAVPATCVVGEAMLAISLGKTFRRRYGGDSMKQIRRQVDNDRNR